MARDPPYSLLHSPVSAWRLLWGCLTRHQNVWLQHTGLSISIYNGYCALCWALYQNSGELEISYRLDRGLEVFLMQVSTCARHTNPPASTEIRDLCQKEVGGEAALVL